MTDDAVWSAVIRWIALHAGCTVIRSHEGGRRPAKPYVMVNFTTSREVRENPQRIEWAEDTAEDEVTATPVIETEWQFSIHAYGNTPSDILRPIRSVAHLPQPNEPLMPSLAVHEVSAIRHVPDYINEAWEPRAQMDLFVHGLTRDGVLVDVIEDVSFDIQPASE